MQTPSWYCECTKIHTQSVHVNHTTVTKDILTNTVNIPVYRNTVSEHTYTDIVSAHVNPISIMKIYTPTLSLYMHTWSSTVNVHMQKVYMQIP